MSLSPSTPAPGQTNNVVKKSYPIFIALHNQNRYEDKNDSSRNGSSRSTDNELRHDELFELQENLRVKDNALDGFELFLDLKRDRQPLAKKMKKPKKKDHKQKESHFNTGRWQKEEHQRFVEAILKFGNEWKKVQKYVKTRSSTQARSHAQKFFYKIKKNNVLDIDIDLNKNSIKTLYEFANKLDEEKYVNTIKTLNIIAFEKNPSLMKEKSCSSDCQSHDEDNFSKYENTITFFGRSDSFNEDIIITEEINPDCLSENTSSSSFKKANKKDFHYKHYLEDDTNEILNEIEKTLEENNEKKKKSRRKGSLVVYYPVLEVYHSCEDEDSSDTCDEQTIQNCLNDFFNNKDQSDRFEEEEFVEKYCMLQDNKIEVNLSLEKKKPSGKLFQSEVSQNPNMRKPKRKLFQISSSPAINKSKVQNDFLKQKRIKFVTTNNSVDHFLKVKEDVRKTAKN